jgi:putative transposase
MGLTVYSRVLYTIYMRTELRSNNNVAYSCKYHVIFCPKYRRKVLTADIGERLRSIIHEVADETKCEVIELEVMLDHVHILCEVDPQFGVHKFVKLVKGRSSRYLRQEFPILARRLPTLWTNSYAVLTVGGAPLSVIKQYIENQKNV